MARRGEVARRLRFAVFCVSVAIVAALIWAGICYAAPAALRCIADEGERWDAEQEGLQEAYDAELLREIERSAK